MSKIRDSNLSSYNENDETMDYYSSNDDEIENVNVTSNNVFKPIKSDNSKMEDNQDKSSRIDHVKEQKDEESDGELDLENLPETVSILKTKDGTRTIYLVGTSHFSKQSHRDVRRMIRTVRPRVVVLELCPSRMCFISMNEEEIMKEAKSLDFRKILDYMRKNGYIQGFIYSLLLSASAKVTKDLSLAPGGEFRNAYKEAMKIPGCSIVLGDRPVDITLRRAISALSTWQKIKITYHCLFSYEELNEEELEKYKQKDILEQLIDELSAEFPGLSKVMVDERDAYLSYSLWNASKTVAPGSTIVGVVGIGHSAGIRNKWSNVENIDIREFLKVSIHRPSKTFLVIKYSFYGAIAYGVYRHIVPTTIKNWFTHLGQVVMRKLF